MRKSYKVLLAILVLVTVMALVLTGCSSPIDKQLVKNSSFEELTDNAPNIWNEYTAENTTGKFAVDTVGQGSVDYELLGQHYVTVEISGKAGTAYYFQKVKLFADNTYELSVSYRIDKKIKPASGTEGAVGAYFGFLEDGEFTVLSETDVSDGWVTKTVYIKPAVTASYTLTGGIGREDLGGATGKVAFDNLSVKRVSPDVVPEGETVLQISPTHKIDAATASGIAYTVVLSVAVAALFIMAYYLLRKVIRRQGLAGRDDEFGGGNSPKLPFKEHFKKENLKKTFTSPFAMFIYVLSGAFILRAVFVFVLGGVSTLLTGYGDLALDMATEGLRFGFITSTALPSGYLYILYLIGLIGNSVGAQAGSASMSILLRMPNVVADIVACYLIFVILNKHYNYKISSVFAGLYAIAPVFFNMSTAYGANYSIALAFILGMVMFMLEKKHIGAISMWTLAFLFSYDALLLLPLLLGYEIYYCVRDRQDYKKSILPIVGTSVGAFAVFYALSIPFATEAIAGNAPINGWMFAFTNILDAIKTNVMVTNSTFNMYAIFGLGASQKGTATIVVSAILAVALIALGIYAYIKSGNRLDFTFLAAMSMISWTVFGVGAKMETMILGITLLMLYAALKNDRRVYSASGVMSVAAFINSAVIMTYSGYIAYEPADTASLQPFYYLDPLYIIGSIVMLLATLYMLYVGFDIMVNGHESAIRPMSDKYSEEIKKSFNEAKTKVISKFKR